MTVLGQVLAVVAFVAAGALPGMWGLLLWIVRTLGASADEGPS
ncbi:hypothetical protein [Streptomyces sp. RFCAC02]|nr:hypothetical protein [Streptomyces sp. RFCAC02]